MKHQITDTITKNNPDAQPDFMPEPAKPKIPLDEMYEINVRSIHRIIAKARIELSLQ